MQGVRAVVGRQGVLLAVEGELALGDAVGDAADGAAEVRVVAEIAFQVVEAEDDVGQLAVLVGDVQLGEGGAVGDDLGLGAAGVGEGEFLDHGAVRHLAELPLRGLGGLGIGGDGSRGTEGGRADGEQQFDKHVLAPWCETSPGGVPIVVKTRGKANKSR